MTAAVTPLEARCEVCLDTGSKSQDLNGDLDCHNCQAALERIELRGTMRRIGVKNIDGMNWRAYQLGKNSTQSDAYDAQYVTLNRIDMHDGAWLEKESKTGDWLFKRNSGFERYLNEFEAGFVNAALVSKVVAAPVVPVAAQPVAYADPQAFENFDKVRSSQILNHSMEHEWMWARPSVGLVPMYLAAPHIEAQPAGEVVAALKVARNTLLTAEYVIKGREHTGFITNAIAVIDKAMAQGDKHGN